MYLSRHLDVIMLFLFHYLDYEDKKKPAKMSTEDKKAAIKQLIDLIPTEKSQLFAWKMDWDQVDQVYYRNVG